jgi:hypothetical protein
MGQTGMRPMSVPGPWLCENAALRNHPTAFLDPIEEPFDAVASAIEVRAKADRIAAVAFSAGYWPKRLSSWQAL